MIAVDGYGFPVKVRPQLARAFGAGEKFHRREPPVLAARSLAELLAVVDDARAGLGDGLTDRPVEHDADRLWLRLLALAIERPRGAGVLTRDLGWFDEPQDILDGSTPFEAARDLPRYYKLLGRLVLNGGQALSAEDQALLTDLRSFAASPEPLVGRAFAALAPRCHYSAALASIYFTLLRLPGEGGATLYHLAARSDVEAVARALLDHFDATLPSSADEAGEHQDDPAGALAQDAEKDEEK